MPKQTNKQNKQTKQTNKQMPTMETLYHFVPNNVHTFVSENMFYDKYIYIYVQYAQVYVDWFYM